MPHEENELGEESKKLAFPRKFRHKLCSLRHELIESFVDNKYVQFVKFAALQLQQLNAKKAENSTDEAKNPIDEAEKEIEDAKQLIKELTSSTGRLFCFK